MDRLLLVTYWYPPAIGAAAQRMHAFARYLPAHGFEVHVLTAARSPTTTEDGVLLHPVEDPLADGTPLMADYEPAGASSKLAACARDLVFPDRFLHWAHAAICAGRQVIQRHRINAILVSFPPASAVLVALELAEESGLPLILDVRDRWIGPGGYTPVSAGARQRYAELERRAVTRSAAVVTVSEPLADAVALEQTYPRGQIWVIPNGYDPIEATQTATPPDDKQSADGESGLTIAHVGTVIERNRPDVFFDSLRQLKQKGGLAGVRFRFVGNLSQAYLKQAGLSEVVESTGMVSREQANAEMRRADALLLLTGEYVGRWGVSAKLFEYLHAGRPVLCLEEAPNSNDRALLSAMAPKRSFVARLTDAPAIGKALDEIRSFVAAHPDPLDPLEGLERFSRASQAAELGKQLQHLLKNLRTDYLRRAH